MALSTQDHNGNGSREPETLQLINEDKHMSDSLTNYIQEVGLQSCGLDYHLISVFGSQSTGKSTLLNALFGTHFDVMNELQRQQTTKGIWLARAKMGNILVMDVEGTDGRERGEDQDFERKAALFALATSEVLILNMWEHQVGLFQGANMGLLKTVFEVNLNLFANANNKSLLLFVIRDFIGVTPLEGLAETLRSDLTKIWESLAKPESLKDCKLEKFFDLQFAALPHKILQPEKFISGVNSLADRFENNSNPNYLFKPNYHRNVPLDGWKFYAEKVWEQIELNKDLDLPTQHILVARFRCDEIASNAYSDLEKELKPLEEVRNLNPDAIIEHLGDNLSNARSKALQVFDGSAARYATTVYKEKRLDLLEKIDLKVQGMYRLQLDAGLKRALRKFDDVITAGRKRQTQDKDLKFVTIIDSAVKSAFELFEQIANVDFVKESQVTYDVSLSTLRQELEEKKATVQKEEIGKLVRKQAKLIASDVDDNLGPIFLKAPKDLWDQVSCEYTKSFKAFLARYKSSESETSPGTLNGAGTEEEFDFGLGLSESETESVIANINIRSWSLFKRAIANAVTNETMSVRLRTKFEDSFRYDQSKGGRVPRVWNPSMDIDSIYAQARDESLRLIPLFSKAILSDGQVLERSSFGSIDASDGFEQEDDDVSADQDINLKSLISPNRAKSLENDCDRLFESIYLEAKRGSMQSYAKIPPYFYVLLLVLGWNEFMAVLRNPILFAFVLILAGGTYLAYSINMLGPIITISTSATNRAVNVGKDILREALNETRGSKVAFQEHVVVEETTIDDKPDDIQLQDLSPKE